MFSKALLILSLTSVAFATLYVTYPVTSTTIDAAGASSNITWIDNGSTPSLSAFGACRISLYTGNTLQQTSLQVLNDSVDVSQVSSIPFNPTPSIGPNGTYYFIRVDSISGKSVNGSSYQAFSSRFTLIGMTGQFSAAVSSQNAGQTTAPLAGATLTAGLTSSTSMTTGTGTSKSATGTSSAAPSATKNPNGAMGIKAAWTGIVFGGLVGITMF